MWSLRAVLQLSLLGLATVVLAADTPTQLTTDGCVDSKGLQTCLNRVAADSKTCLDNAKAANSEVETLACGCVYYTENINCYAASCWNRVYQCEYQEYVFEFFKSCNTAKLPMPYFPAPDDAQDACSCNLGKVYKTFIDSVNTGNTCIKSSSSISVKRGLDTLNKLLGCECCEMSAALSSIYETCPDTDPNLIGVSYVSELEKAYNQPFSECGQYMSSVDCQKDLGFTAVSSLIQPDHTPASTGSATLSNGAGTVTSPASGAVFTYTNAADSQVYTITAASSSGGGGAKKGSSDTTATAESNATGGSKKDANSGAVRHSVVGGWGTLGLVTVLVLMG